jgi:hypothetical protein
MPQTPSFRESNLWSTPIRDLGLTIKGTRLEPLVAQVMDELRGTGIIHLTPRFYLSTEWGVPFETIAIAIPFYLASTELAEVHRERAMLVEGFDRQEILRYLRHELGHAVNYAWRLYDREDWLRHFGAITQPYEDDYTPEPFSRRHVRHLPGWYAQKHPDEDWSETFAVWITPGSNWRSEYAGWPVALAKLQFCDRLMQELGATIPPVTDDELDEDVAELDYSLEEFYQSDDDLGDDVPPGLDGALRAIFGDLGRRTGQEAPRPAADLMRRLERGLMANVFRWTGHFPERTQVLLRHLEERAQTLGLGYDPSREESARLAITTFVTALAMNHIHRGSYLP